jgi:mannose/cellobiose epimerase-like protein (N-acyl-D-glucosamine 2-epimerase family)
LKLRVGSTRLWNLLPALFALTCAWAGPPHTGETWLRHLKADLLPYWAMPEAFGAPVGNFPTFRCNDGKLPDPAALCPEIKAPPRWIQTEVNRTYVRMQGRQTYAYGVAFHLTGERKWLDLAKAGAAHTLKLLDPATGAPTYFEGGQALPGPEARNAQDQSYAMVGVAMLYYLTRDPELERALIAHEKFVFSHYWDDAWGMLRWVPAGGPEDEARRQELVAQLDQLNAYMILVAPYLPEPARTAWLKDIRRLAQTVREKYFDSATGTFAGTLDKPDSRKPGARHNDFGHTIKAYWMLMLAGRELKDPELEAFAKRGAAKILPWAWHEPSKAWASEWKAQGVNTSKTWWIFAELDQMAATLAQEDRSYGKYLETSGPFWLEKMTDHAHGEVWGWVSDQGWVPPDSLKIHHWKSGFHSFEHALVAYLGAQALAGEPAVLHFATGQANPLLRPYLLRGRAQSVRVTEGLQTVRFRMMAPPPGR